MKKMFAILGVVSVLAISSLALAGPGGPGYGRGYGQGPCWGPGGYNAQITPEQAKAYQAKLAQFEAQTLELRKQMAIKRLELRAMRVQPNADVAKMQALYKELVDLRAQVAKKRIEILGDTAGFGPGYGRGFGRGMRGQGRGGYGQGFGPGSCWR